MLDRLDTGLVVGTMAAAILIILLAIHVVRHL